MASIDARKEEYEHVELFGKPALFTNERVSRFTVPQGWFCYDLRGKDSDPGDPATIEKYVGVNHAGTILSPAEIPFKKGKDFMTIKDGLNFLGDKMTLEQFCAEHGLAYPADTRKYAPRPASHSEAGLFYALKPELEEMFGSIGHLRMDFGRRGTEFWTSWFDYCDDKLNTPEFKTEIDEVVNELRETVLKDRATMRSYCADFGGELGESLGIRQYGYVVETEHYRYFLRCKPQKGDYDGYLQCFDRRVQEMNQAQKKKEIQTINEQIRPFDIQMHALSDYYLALRFSFFEGEDAGYPIANSAAFLKEEFGTGGKGVTIAGQKYALWYNGEGVHIAAGNRALTPNGTTISWTDAALLISDLLRKGMYATQENIDGARGNEFEELAQKLAYMRQDFSEEAREQGFLPSIESAFSGNVYPEITLQITELLRNPESRAAIVSELRQFADSYALNGDLLRFRRIHDPETLWARLSALDRPVAEFHAVEAFEPVRASFITEDEIDELLKRSGANRIDDGKFGLRSWNTSRTRWGATPST